MRIGSRLSPHGGGLFYCRASLGIIDALSAVLRCFRGVHCLSVCFRLSERTRVFAQPLVSLKGHSQDTYRDTYSTHLYIHLSAHHSRDTYRTLTGHLQEHLHTHLERSQASYGEPQR